MILLNLLCFTLVTHRPYVTIFPIVTSMHIGKWFDGSNSIETIPDNKHDMGKCDTWTRADIQLIMIWASNYIYMTFWKIINHCLNFTGGSTKPSLIGARAWMNNYIWVKNVPDNPNRHQMKINYCYDNVRTACLAPSYHLKQWWLVVHCACRMKLSEKWVKTQQWPYKNTYLTSASPICRLLCSGLSLAINLFLLDPQNLTCHPLLQTIRSVLDTTQLFYCP